MTNTELSERLKNIMKEIKDLSAETGNKYIAITYPCCGGDILLSLGEHEAKKESLFISVDRPHSFGSFAECLDTFDFDGAVAQVKLREKIIDEIHEKGMDDFYDPEEWKEYEEKEEDEEEDDA